MTTDTRTVLKILSLCLSYPEAELKEALAVARTAVQAADDDAARAKIAAVLAHFENRPLLELQEHYSAVFDLNPAACLNLTYHALGDREERGAALAGLAELYSRAGYEPAANELPDYLPLVLEFLAVAPGSEATPLLGRALAALPVIAQALDRQASVYAGLLEVLCGLFPTPAPLETMGPGPSPDPLSNPNRGV